MQEEMVVLKIMWVWRSNDIISKLQTSGFQALFIRHFLSVQDVSSRSIRLVSQSENVEERMKQSPVKPLVTTPVCCLVRMSPLTMDLWGKCFMATLRIQCGVIVWLI